MVKLTNSQARGNFLAGERIRCDNWFDSEWISRDRSNLNCQRSLSDAKEALFNMWVRPEDEYTHWEIFVEEPTVDIKVKKSEFFELVGDVDKAIVIWEKLLCQKK